MVDNLLFSIESAIVLRQLRAMGALHDLTCARTFPKELFITLQLKGSVEKGDKSDIQKTRLSEKGRHSSMHEA